MHIHMHEPNVWSRDLHSFVSLQHLVLKSLLWVNLAGWTLQQQVVKVLWRLYIR